MIAQERGRPVFRARERRKSYLPLAFALSAAAHGLVYLWGYAPARATHPPVELDLTMSGHLGHLGAPHAVPRPAAPTPPPAPKPAEWVKATNKPAPLPDLTKPSAPAAPKTAPAPAATAGDGPPGEYGEGEGDMTQLTRLPQLKNLSDLHAILRRLYPEEERLRGGTGTVVIDLHVDADGRVTSVDVVRTSTPAFDEAARKVGMLLRFTPAYLGTQRVAVKLRQAIQFNLAE
jgi:TonB family protein